MKGIIFISRSGRDIKRRVFSLLEAVGLERRVPKRVLIKPNLVEALKPPVTTPVELVEAVVDYIRERRPGTEIVVGDGTGAMGYDTWHCFRELGYLRLAEKGVRLVDLNSEPCVRLEKPELARLPEVFIPRIALDSFLVSVPVLKAHTLSEVTLTMKNMIGLMPPSHYQQGGHWKKSAFHYTIHPAIADLNRYRTPDFTLLDATTGMKEAHLWGPTLKPPPDLLLAGYDPVTVDACGADLLKKDWQGIEHITLVNGLLGSAEPARIENIGT